MAGIATRPQRRQPLSAFTSDELDYLQGRNRLGRLATVSRGGSAQVAPVAWSFNADLGTIDIGGPEFDRTRKYRDVQRCGRAAIVIDDSAPADPGCPCGIEIRGRAETVCDPVPTIRIHPERVVSWGLEDDPD